MSVAPEHDAVSSILRRGAVPELFVFDLDMTIWRAHVDCTTGAPFRRQERDTAIACGGERICMFRDSRKILDGLKSAGARMAAASRTTTPDDARDLLATLDMVTYFESESLMQIFPAGKQAHFKRLHEASGVDYSKMIFFDDEPWNISDVSKLGVTCVYVDRAGMTLDLFESGLDSYRDNLKRHDGASRKLQKKRSS